MRKSPFEPGGRTLAEIEADLSKPIPPEMLSKKKKGGTEITIFTWVTAQRALSYYAPGWQGEPKLTYSGERVGCVFKLCIPTSDCGLVCRGASGDDSEDDDDMSDSERRQREYGSPTTRAEGQAFKRAAARFGFGLYLRDKAPQRSSQSSGPHAEEPRRYQKAQQPHSEPPQMRDPDAAATGKQIKAIYTIGRGAKRLSEPQVDDRCMEVFGVRPQELTKREASQLIDMLKGDGEPEPAGTGAR